MPDPAGQDTRATSVRAEISIVMVRLEFDLIGGRAATRHQKPWQRLLAFAIRVCIPKLEFPRIADPKLELAARSVVDIMVNGDAIIETQRADGQVDAQA
jgi:hypothetical protein